MKTAILSAASRDFSAFVSVAIRACAAWDRHFTVLVDSPTASAPRDRLLLGDHVISRLWAIECALSQMAVATEIARTEQGGGK